MSSMSLLGMEWQVSTLVRKHLQRSDPRRTSPLGPIPTILPWPQPPMGLLKDVLTQRTFCRQSIAIPLSLQELERWCDTAVAPRGVVRVSFLPQVPQEHRRWSSKTLRSRPRLQDRLLGKPPEMGWTRPLCIGPLMSEPARLRQVQAEFQVPVAFSSQMVGIHPLLSPLLYLQEKRILIRPSEGSESNSSLKWRRKRQTYLHYHADCF